MACSSCNNSGTNEINTLACTQDMPCAPAATPSTCVSSPVSACTSGNCQCGCNPCSCMQSATATPTPFYNAAGAVQETHCKTVVQQQFVTSLVSSSTFNVPACNATSVVTFPGLQKIQIGSYLWNAQFGYFEVMSFDYLTSQVTIKNVCLAPCDDSEGYASPGTPVPSCTQFNVVDPPCSGTSGQIGIFLAVDFVAPAVGNCIDIAVTGVAGITVGANVQVGSGIYRVSAIVNPTTITICNDGSGVVHGTTVYAKDANNQYITPITPLSTDACSNTPITQGKLLACGVGVQAPLDALMNGQVPVVIDAATNTVEYQTLDVPTVYCTTMTSCLNLIAGTVDYVLVVADASGFSVGDLLVIDAPGYEDVRWLYTGIVGDAQHLAITRTTPQLINDQIGCNGAAVCAAPCCEQISYTYQSDIQEVNGPSEVTTINPTVTADFTTRTVVFANPTSKVMNLMFAIDCIVFGTFNAREGDVSNFIIQPFTGTDEVPIGDPHAVVLSAYTSLKEHKFFGTEAGSETCGPGPRNYSKTFSHTGVFTIQPGMERAISAYIKFIYTEYLNGASESCMGVPATPPYGTGVFTVESAFTGIHGITVPESV